MNNIHQQQLVSSAFFLHNNIHLFPIFIAIYEYRSITLAAQSLCMTQSALSHALKKLRQSLDDELFIRQGHQMQPTPFSESIYPQVFESLSCLQKISDLKHHFDPSSIQQLNLAIHHEIEPLVFPSIVQHFQTSLPHLRCNSFKLNRDTLYQDLKSYQIDFAIDLEPQIASKLEFSPLFNDQFVICTQLNSMTEDVYFTSPHIGVSSRRSGILFEDLYLQRPERPRDIMFRCQHYTTAIQILLAHPQAILTIPKRVLSQLDDQSQIVHLNHYEFPFNIRDLSFGIYFYGVRDKDLRVRFLKEKMIEIFA